MKKQLLLLTPLFFALAIPAFAEDVVTGDAHATSYTQTTINNGGGSINSRTINIVNGQKTEVDSSESGETEVQDDRVIHGPIIIRKPTIIVPTITISTPTATITPKIKPVTIKKSFFHELLQKIEQYFLAMLPH